MSSASNPQVIPIELMRALFVADPVPLRVPERTCFQSDDPKSSPSKPLNQYPTRASNTDDAIVDGFSFGESPHRAKEASAWARDDAASVISSVTM